MGGTLFAAHVLVSNKKYLTLTKKHYTAARLRAVSSASYVERLETSWKVALREARLKRIKTKEIIKIKERYFQSKLPINPIQR